VLAAQLLAGQIAVAVQARGLTCPNNCSPGGGSTTFEPPDQDATGWNAG
jgi:hypothetical protein